MVVLRSSLYRQSSTVGAPRCGASYVWLALAWSGESHRKPRLSDIAARCPYQRRRDAPR